MKRFISILITLTLIVLTNIPVSAEYNPFTGSNEYTGIPVPVFDVVDFNKVPAVELKIKPGSRQLKDNIVFSDMDRHWAESYVINMAAQSVIRGYGDRLFGPEDSVSRQEAVAFLVRILGRESQVQRQAGQGQTQKAGDRIFDLWASGYIEEAERLGVITPYDSGNWKENATREEVAVWFARALKLQPVYGPSQQAIYRLKDWKEISIENLPYIEAVLQRGIMQGNDRGYFNPGNRIKRSEVVVMLDRVSGDFYDSRGIKAEKGIVLIQGRSLGILKTDGAFVRVDCSGEDFPMLRGGKVIYASGATPGDAVEFLSDNEGVFFARVLGQDEILRNIDNLGSSQSHYGRIVGIDVRRVWSGSRAVERTHYRVLDIDGGIYEFARERNIDTGETKDIGVYRNGENGTTGLLKTGDTIRYVVLNNRYILYIDLLDSGEQVVEGYVQKAGENNTIEITGSDGLSRTYGIMNNTEVIIDSRPADIRDLKFGQWVSLKISGGLVREIDAGMVNYNRGYVSPLSVVRSGKIKSMGRNSIVVSQDNGEEREYSLTPYSIITKSGKAASVSDLKLGDRVKIYLDDIYSGEVSKIDIQSDALLVDGVYKGKLDSVNLSAGELTLKDTYLFNNTGWEDYKYKLTLEVDDDTPVYYRGNRISLSALKNLYMNKTLYASIVNSFDGKKAVQIVVKSGSEGFYNDQIRQINWGSGEFELENRKNITTSDGTMYLSDRRMVDISVLDEDYSVYVVTDSYDGYNNAIFVSVNLPLQSDFSIYVGRLNEIRSDEFDVNYYSLLEENEWDTLSSRSKDKTFRYDNDTEMIDVTNGYQELDPDDFFHGDYADDSSSKSDDDYYVYIIADDEYARAVRIRKGGIISTEDEISNSILEELRISRGEVKSLDLLLSYIELKNGQNWSDFYNEWQPADSDLYINTDRAVIYKRGRVAGIEDLKAGDVLYIIRDDNRGIIILVQ